MGHRPDIRIFVLHFLCFFDFGKNVFYSELLNYSESSKENEILYDGVERFCCISLS